MRALLPERVGQIYVDASDVLLVVDKGIYPSDPSVPAWTLISLENGQLYVLSEDWINIQNELGTRL